MNGLYQELVITRTLNAPRELVFKAFAEAQRLAQWWGPKGFAIEVKHLEFAPGGVFHYSMKLPDGMEMWGKFVYHQIIAPEKIVYASSFSDAEGGLTRHPMRPEWPLEILNTLTLEQQNGKTTLTLRGGPINATEEEIRFFNEVQSGVKIGFNATFDQLEQYLHRKETNMKPITVSATVQAPLQTAWDAYTNPEHIVKWNFASDDWHCPSATQDLRVGGKFSSRMAAKDGSFAFDFEGEYTQVELHQSLAYRFGDRQAEVVFEEVAPDQTRLTVTFDPETENPEEMQRSGWQAIVNNYKKHTESLGIGA